MDEHRAKILILVEGAKTDVALMKHLLDVYGIGERHEIVSYNTNIYVLYNMMFRDENPESLDLLQVLKEWEKDEEKKKIFDERYSDILLIFDLDPQDRLYDEEKIREMLLHFSESSDNGKLYLNYPMVEAFYHMKSIPDEDYYSYVVSLEELKNKAYKKRVQLESRDKDYRKFAKTKQECDFVIAQNYKKAQIISCNKSQESSSMGLDIFTAQAEKIRSEARLHVLSTCGFYIMDYNSNLIELEEIV